MVNTRLPGRTANSKHRRFLALVASAATLAALLSVGVLRPATPAGAATVTPPDLQIKVPTNLISVGTVNGVRQLQFTHITWDAGTGPFEIDPTYNSTTGTATFQQAIYNSPSPGKWQFDHSVPVSATGVFVAPSDYQFPLTRFTLNTVNPDGSPGTVLATSPKVDYCITADTFVGGVPNTPNQTYIPQTDCTNPSAPLGWSVGWGDQYDQTDSGQPISLAGIPNGTYVLRALVDPLHVLTESNAGNNETDTTLTISNSSVTVLSQTQPGITPPSVTVTSPANGATVSGNVTLSATASATAPDSIASVVFLLDGQPLSPPVTTSPYTYSWATGSTPLGTHVLAAQATDTAGETATSGPVAVTVVSSGGIGVDKLITVQGHGTTTTATFSTTTGPETLVAFVDSDGPAGSGKQTLTVSGAGLTWTLAKRVNGSSGDSEIWTARASAALNNVQVTSTPSKGGYDQFLTLMAFEDSGGAGATAGANAPSGAPAVSLTTTAAGSLSYATGNDWDNATGRTVAAGQVLISQDVDRGAQDTYWTQATSTPATGPGQAITLRDTAPTSDQWNLAAVEIKSAPSGADTTPPTASITNPTPGETVSGTVPVAANANDNVAVASVQFYLDGQPLGGPVTTAPYAVSWDTTKSANGAHTLTAVATDPSGNTGTSQAVNVTVSNPAPPMTCFVLQANVSVHGVGNVTSPGFHTAAAGEVLIAFVAADGPSGAGQQHATVSGAGLTWRLVNRANSQSGDSEVWTATAPAVLSSATVTSTEAVSGFSQDLTVIAMEGVSGIGASVAASGPTGAPSTSLTTTAATSLVFAVGNDWDTPTPRTLPAGWVPLDQWVNTTVGDDYWSQYTNNPTGPAGSVVPVGDLGPTSDSWNLVAIEVLNDGS